MIENYKTMKDDDRFCPDCHHRTYQTLEEEGWLCNTCKKVDYRIDMPKLKALTLAEKLELVLMEGGHCPRCSLGLNRDGCMNGSCEWPWVTAE